jgi:hypothetical protein
MWTPELAQRDRDARGKPLVALDRNGKIVAQWKRYKDADMWDTDLGLASYAAVELMCNKQGWTLHVAVVTA